jgi:hypothetical protein
MPGRKADGPHVLDQCRYDVRTRLPKIPDRISAWRTSRRSAPAGRVPGDIASTVFVCKTFRFGRACSDGMRTPLTSAHHDEVVAMDATEDASALIARRIMTPTLGRPLNVG